MKINCDGAIFADKNKLDIRVVTRDNLGSILGSLSKQLPQAYTPLEIEAMAAVTALQFASDLGFTCAVLESDSQVLVNVLYNEIFFLSLNGLLIEDIRFNARFFNQLHYSLVKREGNMVAYNLARHALCILDFVVWMEDVRPPLLPVTLVDNGRFS